MRHDRQAAYQILRVYRWGREGHAGVVAGVARFVQVFWPWKKHLKLLMSQEQDHLSNATIVNISNLTNAQ